MRNLDALFNPRSIAVIGASTDPTKVGSIIVKNLIDSGFSGKIYPVNPKATAIHSLPAYADLQSIPDSIDQVTICIPANGVLQAVSDCAVKGVSSIIIISAGFSETGSANKKLQDDITKICQENHITLVGPNVIGVIHPATRLNNSWMQRPAIPGSIAFVSQSGALCCSILDVAAHYDLRFSHFCSIGNKADLDELDLIDYFQQNDEVKVIAAYLEDVTRGYDFIRQLRLHTNKPVIIYHSGKTAPAATAALSHTGSMTSDRDLIRTAFQAANILEATTVREFCLLMQAFSHTDLHSLPQSSQYAIITNAGGPGIIATDELVNLDGSLASLSNDTKTKLQTLLPPAASVNNPVDILGDALADRYAQALDIVGDDPEVKIIINIVTPQHVTQAESTAKTIVDYATKHQDKTVLTVFLGDEFFAQARQLLITSGFLAFNEIRDAIRISHFLTQYARNLKACQNQDIADNYRYVTEYHHGNDLLTSLLADQTKSPLVLPDQLAHELMREVGIELPDHIITADLNEALSFAQNHFPLVIKATNQTLIHKTDAGGVITNITNNEQLANAFTNLQNQLNQNNQAVPLLLQEMITDSKLEFFLGAKRDGNSHVYQGNHRGFGHLITFGQGGIYTEVHRDLARFLVPDSPNHITQLLHQTKIYSLIQGYRGQAPLPENTIIDAIMAIQKLVIAYPEITALDINPLLITPQKAVAVDVKIFIAK